MFRGSESRNNQEAAIGTVRDFESYVRRLLNSEDPNAFLRIAVHGSDVFLQLTTTRGGAEMSFPLLLPRQRLFQERIREVAGRERLPVVAASGDPFLYFYVPGSASQIAAICEVFVHDVYAARAETTFAFEHDALVP